MSEISEHIVEFDKYCKTCKYKDYPEEAIPCCDCLEDPVNSNSKIPTRYKKEEPKKKNKKVKENK